MAMHLKGYSSAIKIAVADCLDTFYEEGSDIGVDKLISYAELLSDKFDEDYEVVLEDLSDGVEHNV